MRQVDDIRRMVDEFSRFARMPKPVMEGEDVADTVRQAVFPDAGRPSRDRYRCRYQARIRCGRSFDRRLISQALTNIIKNATEAIEAGAAGRTGQGRIDVIAQRENDDIIIDVIDNGIGLPKVARARLLEPYVTTRQKGTGLGLAIVGRVLEYAMAAASSSRMLPISRPAGSGVLALDALAQFAVSGHAPKGEAKEAGFANQSVTNQQTNGQDDEKIRRSPRPAEPRWLRPTMNQRPKPRRAS